MLETGQQWDFPNAWPPLQHMIVVGLEKTGQPEAQAVAFDLAQRWLLNNYVAYQQVFHYVAIFSVYLCTYFYIGHVRPIHQIVIIWNQYFYSYSE